MYEHNDVPISPNLSIAMALELNKVVFFGRSWNESMKMYGLDSSQLHGKRILDCPGGPSGLVAGGIERGIDMTAVDPQYRETAETLVQRGTEDIKLTIAKARKDPSLRMEDDEYNAFEREKHNALTAFIQAYHKYPKRFVVGSLPKLPFEEGAFDLVLSGHLLFVYAPRSLGGIMKDESFDLNFHIAAARELIRVGNEVRIFPTYAFTGAVRRQPWVTPVSDVLRDDGHKLSFVPSQWQQQGHVKFNDSLQIICGTR